MSALTKPDCQTAASKSSSIRSSAGIACFNTRLIYGLAIYLLVIIVGTTVFFNLESVVNPNVGAPDDALWYMIVTMTSVGHGDIVPYTGLGRISGLLQCSVRSFSPAL